jgi:hypothetical protein
MIGPRKSKSPALSIALRIRIIETGEKEYPDLRVIHYEFSILNVNILSKFNTTFGVPFLWAIPHEVRDQPPVLVKVDISGAAIEVAIFLSLDNAIVVHEMIAQRQLRIMELAVISKTIATEYSRVGIKLQPNNAAINVVWTVAGRRLLPWLSVNET